MSATKQVGSVATLAQMPPVTEVDPQRGRRDFRGQGGPPDSRVSPQRAGWVPRMWNPCSRLQEVNDKRDVP